MHSSLRTVAAALFVFWLSSDASAQVASALLREGSALPGGAPGHTVTALNNTAVNQLGGYAATVNTSDGVTTLSQAWGHATGGAGAVLFQEGTFGPLVQTSWESFFGIDDAGQVAYSAGGSGGPAGGFDSVWVDATPIAVEGAPSSVAGQFWRFGSRPGITRDGQPYFVGGLTSTVGGSTQNYGLFFGLAANPVLLGGTAVPGLPFLLSTSSSVSFDFRFSSLGSHYIAEVQMASGSTANDGAMVIDGSGLTLGGGLVREGDPVPAVVGGIGGENWDNFDFTGIDESGAWFFSGDTDGATTTDEIVVRGGVIIHREGDVLDGEILTGAIEGAFMNENGDLAFVWDIDSAGTALEALYVNGQLFLQEGDTVDLDGDGTVEPTSILANFTGISALTVGPTLCVYFTADVDVNGTPSTADDIEGFFRLEAGRTVLSFCTAKTGLVCGLPAISAAGSPSATQTSGFVISATPARSCRSGILLYNTGQLPVALPFQGGTLCVATMGLRRAGSTNSMGTPGNNCDGVFALDMNAFAQAAWVVPDCAGAPSGIPSNNPAAFLALPGTTIYTQFWGRDSVPTGSYVSDGVQYDQGP